VPVIYPRLPPFSQRCETVCTDKSMRVAFLSCTGDQLTVDAAVLLHPSCGWRRDRLQRPESFGECSINSSVVFKLHCNLAMHGSSLRCRARCKVSSGSKARHNIGISFCSAVRSILPAPHTFRPKQVASLANRPE
jgi:hypothetical protein